MSHFNLTRSTWVVGTALLAGELASLDAKTFAAINGDSGGSWAPSSVITIGGAGVTSKFVGVSTVESAGQLSFLSGTSALFQSGATLQANAGSTMSFAGQFYLTAGSNTDVFGDIALRSTGTLTTAAGSALTVNGNATFNTSTAFTNGFTASGFASTFNSTAVFLGLTESAGNTQFVSPATLSSTLRGASAGRVLKRPTTVISSAGSNITGYGPANTDVILVRGLTAEVLLLIDNAGVQNDDELEIINKSTANFLGVDTGTGLAIHLKNKNENGNNRSCRIKYISGSWELLSTMPADGNPY